MTLISLRQLQMCKDSLQLSVMSPIGIFPEYYTVSFWEPVTDAYTRELQNQWGEVFLLGLSSVQL